VRRGEERRGEERRGEEERQGKESPPVRGWSLVPAFVSPVGGGARRTPFD